MDSLYLSCASIHPKNPCQCNILQIYDIESDANSAAKLPRDVKSSLGKRNTRSYKRSRLQFERNIECFQWHDRSGALFIVTRDGVLHIAECKEVDNGATQAVHGNHYDKIPVSSSSLERDNFSVSKCFDKYGKVVKLLGTKRLLFLTGRRDTKGDHRKGEPISFVCIGSVMGLTVVSIDSESHNLISKRFIQFRSVDENGSRSTLPTVKSAIFACKSGFSEALRDTLEKRYKHFMKIDKCTGNFHYDSVLLLGSSDGFLFCSFFEKEEGTGTSTKAVPIYSIKGKEPIIEILLDQNKICLCGSQGGLSILDHATAIPDFREPYHSPSLRFPSIGKWVRVCGGGLNHNKITRIIALLENGSSYVFNIDQNMQHKGLEYKQLSFRYDIASVMSSSNTLNGPTVSSKNETLLAFLSFNGSIIFATLRWNEFLTRNYQAGNITSKIKYQIKQLRKMSSEEVSLPAEDTSILRNITKFSSHLIHIQKEMHFSRRCEHKLERNKVVLEVPTRVSDFINAKFAKTNSFDWQISAHALRSLPILRSVSDLHGKILPSRSGSNLENSALENTNNDIECKIVFGGSATSRSVMCQNLEEKGSSIPLEVPFYNFESLKIFRSFRNSSPIVTEKSSQWLAGSPAMSRENPIKRDASKRRRLEFSRPGFVLNSRNFEKGPCSLGVIIPLKNSCFYWNILHGIIEQKETQNGKETRNDETSANRKTYVTSRAVTGISNKLDEIPTKISGCFQDMSIEIERNSSAGTICTVSGKLPEKSHINALCILLRAFILQDEMSRPVNTVDGINAFDSIFSVSNRRQLRKLKHVLSDIQKQPSNQKISYQLYEKLRQIIIL